MSFALVLTWLLKATLVAARFDADMTIVDSNLPEVRFLHDLSLRVKHRIVAAHTHILSPLPWLPRYGSMAYGCRPAPTQRRPNAFAADPIQL